MSRRPPSSIRSDPIFPAPTLFRFAALWVVTARGEIRLTLPPRVAAAEGLRLIEAHRGWITEKVARLPLPRPIAPGRSIPFDGRELTIDWRSAAPRTPRIEDGQNRLIVGGPVDRSEENTSELQSLMRNSYAV